MSTRVVRAIAILILLYTGADLTIPQVCAEEMGFPNFTEGISTGIRNVAASASELPESREDDPSEPAHSDEDCFCCCAHVLPGHARASIAVTELNRPLLASQMIDLASPPLQSPYHPPRFA